MQNEIHRHLSLNLQNGQYSNGYKDLFSIVIILKILLDGKEFKEFYDAIINIVEELKCNISSIDFLEVLDKMLGIMKLCIEVEYMGNQTYLKAICSVFQSRFKRFKKVEKIDS